MTQSAYVPFRGGIDLVTPATMIDPGAALLAINYECPVEGGYRSIEGYIKLGGTLPGQGNVLGVTVWKGDTYAIRETVSGSNAALFVWDGASWTSIIATLSVGRYEFTIGNLFATAADEALYFVCPNGKPYKYDGSTATELTGAQSGAQWISVHRNHLFIGFEVGSVQWSAIGDEADWTSANGAGEIGTGDKLSGIKPARGGVLVFICQDSIRALFGSSSADFEVRDISLNSGGRPYSVASMVTPFFINERGPTSLQAVDSFGDFAESNIGRQIQPLIVEGFTPVASCVSRELSQYRVWASGGRGIRVTISGNTLVGITLTQFPHAPVVADGGEATSGIEILVFGDKDGNVYQMDSGTSFAGGTIQSTLTLAYNHVGQPSARKRFRRAYIESQGLDATEFFVLPGFGYGINTIARHRKAAIDFFASGGLWDLDTWNNFAWSGPYQSDTPFSIAGSGININFSFFHESATTRPHSIKGYSIHYALRRLNRG
jgi:hypothetical protein